MTIKRFNYCIINNITSGLRGTHLSNDISRYCSNAMQ